MLQELNMDMKQSVQIITIVVRFLLLLYNNCNSLSANYSKVHNSNLKSSKDTKLKGFCTFFLINSLVLIIRVPHVPERRKGSSF